MGVQWLGFCASTTGSMGWIPGRGTKIPHATPPHTSPAWPRKKKKRYPPLYSSLKVFLFSISRLGKMTATPTKMTATLPGRVKELGSIRNEMESQSFHIFSSSIIYFLSLFIDISLPFHKFTLLKWTRQWHLAYSQGCAIITTIIPQMKSH